MSGTEAETITATPILEISNLRRRNKVIALSYVVNKGQSYQMNSGLETLKHMLLNTDVLFVHLRYILLFSFLSIKSGSKVLVRIYTRTCARLIRNFSRTASLFLLSKTFSVLSLIHLLISTYPSWYHVFSLIEDFFPLLPSQSKFRFLIR